MAKTSMHP